MQLLTIPFETKNNHYIYDAVTNRVFHAPPPTTQVLSLYQTHSEDECLAELAGQFSPELIHEAYARVTQLINVEDAFFPKHPMQISQLTEKSYWDSLLQDHGIKQLLLIVTDSCNLRCKYCIYGGDYEGYRNHGLEQMSFETAKKAIDYYHQLHQNIFIPNKLMAINFYGGEPLIQFDLIKQCVEYARSLDDGFEFSLTTNGTLMKEEHADFLIENQFNLVFSIDGPQSQHDRNRVYARGKGTFNDVVKAIDMIREKDPEYFNTRVMTNSVIDKDADLIQLNDFFVGNQEKLPKGGFVMPQRLMGDEKRTMTNVRQIQELLRRYVLTKANKETYDTTFLDRYWINMRIMVDRNYFRLEDIDHYTGRCLPGNKIAVRPDGTIHMCERINEQFPIGDVETGVNFHRVNQVMEQYDRQITQDCSTCASVRFCSMCYAMSCTDEGFEVAELCNSIQSDTQNYLIALYTILEQNPDAFDDPMHDNLMINSVVNC